MLNNSKLFLKIKNKPEIISKLTFNDVINVIETSRSIFRRESLIQNIKLLENEKACIIGDIHGNLESLKYLLSIIEENKPKHVIFLGDIVDRGPYQLECLVLVLIYKILNPSNYIILRGNHETEEMNKYYGFYHVVLEKFGDPEKFDRLKMLYDDLPTCAIINDEVLCVHGGIPHDINGLKYLKEKNVNQMDIKKDPKANKIIFEMMWNDPKEGLKGFSHSYRGEGIYFFGEEVFEEFLKINGLKYVIRSHECFSEGYRWFFGGKLLSIFSSANYRGYFSPNPLSYAIVTSKEIISKNVFLKDINHAFF